MLSPVFKGCAWFRLNWRPSKLLSAQKRQKKNVDMEYRESAASSQTSRRKNEEKNQVFWVPFDLFILQLKFLIHRYLLI